MPTEATRAKELAGLIERVEAATGPDREIDEALAEVLLGVSKWKSKYGYWNVSFPANWPYGDRPSNVMLDGREPGYDFDPETGKKLPPECVPTGWADSAFVELPEYTASIDAALSLKDRLLPGCACAVGDMAFTDDPRGPWATIWTIHGEPKWNATAETPPLAILAALLRALAGDHGQAGGAQG